MNKHPSVCLTSPYGDKVQIDEEIAELIQLIWNTGLYTWNSCQDNFGYVWIHFASADEASEFLTIVQKYGDKELRLRANPYDVDPHDRWQLGMRYGVWDDTWLIAAINSVHKRDTHITISIRFPREHLDRVVGVMRRHKKREERRISEAPLTSTQESA